MSIVHVPLRDRGYDIWIEPGLIGQAGSFVGRSGNFSRIALITDRTVSGLYGESVAESLREAGFQTHILTVPDGEDSKSYRELERLHTELIGAGMTRDGLIAALGGGVVGDLAGFTAATFLRGVPFIQIPTTLLAQVDSSVGGKTGINHPLGKNLVGSFHQPLMVLMDPETLKTLGRRDLWAGLAEVVKYGLIRDAGFFAFLEENLDALFRLSDETDVVRMLNTCCRIKAEVVGLDEREGGLRRILNFGHTLGHALEAATEYGYFRHGEAVVWGMRWAAWESHRQGLLAAPELERIDRLLGRLVVPPIPETVDASVLAEKTRLDKKQSARGLNLVLLERIGNTRTVRVTDLTDQIKGWLDHVRT
ncbi:MAG TPA: 3-dehydroquinate synthase [bacterium]|nr:3-dehydroquinate synthase [bacterium]